MTGLPAACSGERYSGVPMTPPVTVRCGLANRLAMPKSVSLAWPVGPAQEQVGRLEVAVDDAAVVGVLQRRGDLPGQVEHLRPRQPAALVAQAPRSWARR